ncbi:MAG: 7-cyano-7-deazaguanine synthase QueC [Candidatus Marinimicrobia bacterium]|nr:7-cyano-7-deazaguanine synthase QueC [Candidatus Neomarinimicrobiota bacterium]
MAKKGLIALSGGLDSATTLAIAKSEDFKVYAISFDYQQRNAVELQAAKDVARSMQVENHKIIKIDLSQIGGSALTDDIPVPKHTEDQGSIPATYVPGRNLIFLSLALAWAEVNNIYDIFIGVNSLDYSGYPDCRPEFIKKFQETANLATKAGVRGEKINIHTPIINMTKGEIIKRGVELGVDYRKTISCYNPDKEGRACGECDSCQLRKEGFKQAGVEDPTKYINKE